MLVGTNWTTWDSMVGQQNCKISGKIDSGMWHDKQDWFLYIRQINDFRQYCHVENTARHCRLGFLQDPDFVGDFEDSKSSAWEVLCSFGSRFLVLVSWMCEKQTWVSHRSKESETFLWMLEFGLLARDVGDMVIDVLRSNNNTVQPKQTNIQDTVATSHSKTKTHNVKSRLIIVWCWFFLPTTQSAQCESQLRIIEGDEVAIKMILKGRTPAMRHVCRTHRILLVIGCSTGSFWHPRSLSNTFATEANSRNESIIFFWWILWVSQCNLVAIWFLFLTMGLESRAPCPNKVKMLFRRKARRWRKRDHAWWRVIRGVRNLLTQFEISGR